MRPGLIAASSAFCLCACVGVFPALGAPVARAKVHHKTVHRRGHAHRARCAKRSSFHAGHGPKHQAKSRASCPKRLSAGRRRAGSHRKTSRHAGSRTPGHRHNKPHAPIRHVPAAVNSTCPDSYLAPNEEDLGRIRAATLCLVNRERTGHGESPLAPSGRLEQAAQGHTEDMAFHDYFEHVGPGGDTLLTRLRAAGYIYSERIGYEIGENIGFGTLWLATPHAIVAAWMASPGHRANILDARFRDTGIGVSPHPPSSLANGQSGAIYTQDFGVIIAG
jgi:uncharacterized protein YkwD